MKKNNIRTKNRSKEVAEIIRLKKAALVGRLMLGELNSPFVEINIEDYIKQPRKRIKAEIYKIRTFLRGELKKFCRQNFNNAKVENLAVLYDDIERHNTHYRFPLQDFINRIGVPHSNVLKGAPAHATIQLSLWGLQTEFPEMHLVRDLAVSYNDILDAEDMIKERGIVSWEKAKGEEFKQPLEETLRRQKYSMRMCLLSCFNLTEAFINGIAWEFTQNSSVENLSKNNQRLLLGGQASLIDKLTKIPSIVKGIEPGPLKKDQEPLLSFREIVKPFRDSIVHASPFSAPERFGGYNKLQRVYELEISTVTLAVELSLAIIGSIQEFVSDHAGLPSWIPKRGEDKRFIIE